MPEITIGNRTATNAVDAVKRLAMIIWGPAGDGKTTLALTAPGNKLWIQFDDGGVDSITGLKGKLEREKPALDTALKSDIYVLDMSKEDKASYVGKFDQTDAFDLSKVLADETLDIQTVVVDSLTSLGNDALQYAIKFANLGTANFRPTLATPGKQAYGVRLAYMKSFITNLLKLTNKFNKNIIFISHSAEKTDSEGDVVAITLALGGNLPNETALAVGEVWYYKNSVEGRTVFLAPFGKYGPMKSRMFNVDKDKKFVFKYDANNPDVKFEIRSLFNQWKNSGYEKIEAPK